MKNQFEDAYDIFGNYARSSGVSTTFDMNKQLTDNPHYSDNRFDKEQTIFGKEEKGLGYDYSDRIWQWNYDKAEQATEHASTKYTPHTANWYQEYLSFFFDKKITLKHVVAGVNKSSGYPYLIFGYK
jgi:hypothetical protein